MKQDDGTLVQPEIPVNEPLEPEQTPSTETPPVVEPEQTVIEPEQMPADTAADIVI